MKDASFIQMHIEKLALGVGLLVLVLAFALFVLGVPFGSPYAVKVGGQSYDDPNAAFAKLESDRSRLEAGINDPNPFTETPEVPNFKDNYLAMIEHPVVTGQPVESFARGGLVRQAISPVPVLPPRYAEVRPPVPTQVQTVFDTDVLDTTFDPEYASAMFALWGGKREPADFSMFVASGEFDIWEWVTRLKGAEDAENKIPPGIWAQRFGIAGVALIREELGSDGTWGSRTIASPLPRQVRYLPSEPVPTDPYQSLQLVQYLRQQQAEIVKPELPMLATDFVPVQAVAPGGDRVDGAAQGFDQFGNPLDDDTLGPNEKRIRDLEEKIAVLEQRRQEREERRQPGTERPQQQPGRGGGFDEFGEPGGGSPRDPGGADRDPFARQIAQYREQIERLRPRAQQEAEARRKAAEAQRLLEERLRAQRQLQGDTIGSFEQQFGGQLGGLGGQGVQLQEGQKVTVWAADPNMEPGKTYRYKLVVAVINPLYGVPRLEPDQLAENQGKAALFPSEADIEAMPWSQPVTVEPRNQFFFASGGERGAKVDIFRRVNGVIQKQTFDASPGDTIGGVVTIEDKQGIQPTRRVDLGIDAVLVDIDSRRALDGKTYFAMIYMDESGNLHERSSAADSASETRRKLDREAKSEREYLLRPDPEAQQQFDRGFGGGGFDEFGGP